MRRHCSSHDTLAGLAEQRGDVDSVLGDHADWDYDDE